MSWTSPRTWRVGGQATAKLLNEQIRDNLDETMPAKAVDAGDLFHGSTANEITRLAVTTTGDQVLKSDGTNPTWAAVPGHSH